ncbi:50S ribosomal protein L5 [bacterium]|nr:50S ribosomal protein L5 [bacterium]
MIHLSEKYKKEVIPAMMKKFGYKNRLAVPKIKQVVINCGFGKLVTSESKSEQKKIQEHILKDMALITGQKPALRKARKSIAGFKLREGNFIGAKVTLRKRRMYDFLERLIYIAFPRSRDFRGLDPNSVDKAGNLTIGVKEHTIFPEISVEKEKAIFGMSITVVTSANSREEGLELLRLMGFPLRVENKKI